MKPVRSSHPSPLQPAVIYHIYNRGVNGQTIFRQPRNYSYFISLYARHILPVADTYAFCLLPNHFHLLLEVKTPAAPQDLSELKSASQAFSNLFNAYSKAFNKAFRRTGPLFERPFKRIPVTDSSYFTRLLIYIHQNPQRHSLIDDYRAWPYSSYGIFTGDKVTFIRRDVVKAWFGDFTELLNAHQLPQDTVTIKDLISDD
jgi:putative transposase